MSKEIKLTDTTYRRLHNLSTDFIDTPEVIIRKLLDHFETHHSQRNARIITRDNESNENLGPRGNQQVRDYLIPIISLIKGDQLDKRSAFKKVADNLGVLYGTVSSQCTRTLGFSSNNDFYHSVIDGTIYNIILNKYSNEADFIRRELGKYFN